MKSSLFSSTLSFYIRIVFGIFCLITSSSCAFLTLLSLSQGIFRQSAVKGGGSWDWKIIQIILFNLSCFFFISFETIFFYFENVFIVFIWSEFSITVLLPHAVRLVYSYSSDIWISNIKGLQFSYALDIWISNIKGLEYTYSSDIWISNIKGIEYMYYGIYGYQILKV